MTGRTCIWATSQDWESPFQVSAHHYAGGLARRGWTVGFLAHPVSPWHLLAADGAGATRRRLAAWRRRGASAEEGRLHHWVPMTLLPPHTAPLLRSARVLDLWPRFSVPGLRHWLVQRGLDRPALVVIDSERYGFLFDWCPEARHVLRVVDDLAGFPNVAPSWVRRLEALAHRADIVVTAAHTLADDLRRRGVARVETIPHGVDLRRFATPQPPPAEYATIPAPRAVYVGALEEWFDVESVACAARHNPGVSFVIIGRGSADLRPLESLANVHRLGARAPASVPAYLQHAHVGLVPFRSGRLTRSVNPLKLHEYRASGLAVVATDWEELRRLKVPAALCRTPEAFAAAVRAAIEAGPADGAPVPGGGDPGGQDWSSRLDALLAIC